MEYTIRVDRPLIDDQVKDIHVSSKANAAKALAMMLILETTLESNVTVLRHEVSDTEMKLVLNTGTYWAFPKGDH